MNIVVSHLNKHIGQQHVLRDVNLHIAEGERVGLLGPNGAGKSTLMKILVGIWHPDASTPPIAVPARIGYLPEQNPLYEDMYVREYLRFMTRVSHVDEDIEALMQRVGLMPEANKRIRELSKGYRQRVGLAQALIGNPELLILDEPTTGLDPNQLVEIRQLIRSVGCTVILSTHIMQEVSAMCDRVIIIDHGAIKLDKQLKQIDNLEQLFIDGTRL